MAQFLYSILFSCAFSLSVTLEAASFRERLQSFCDQIERIGQSLVDTIVYCDCSDQCPAVDVSSIKEECPSVFGADWVTNADPKKLPHARAILAAAGLSSACCDFFTQGNMTFAKYSVEEKSGPSDLNMCSAAPINSSHAAGLWPIVALSPMSMVTPPRQHIRQMGPEKIYRVEDLIFERRGPHGNKDNSIFMTKDGRRLFVKNRHLKGNFDSFLVSYFMSSLGEKLCPGQIVKIVPIIDQGELRIGSFEMENYVGHISPTSKNYVLLSLVLDLMRISDRGRGNVGYSQSTNLAAAVDVDLGGFEEGTTIDLNRSWITRLRDNYDILDDEFRDALKAILSFSDANLLKTLDDAEEELREILPAEHHSILSTKLGVQGNFFVLNMKYKVVETVRQMEWVAKNFDLVKTFTDASQRQYCISELVDTEKLPVDEHGFLLYEAIVREDAGVIGKLCASRGRSFYNILIYGSVKSRNRHVLEAIRRCCLSVPDWISIAGNCDIMLKIVK